jgi:hypothetical protein
VAREFDLLGDPIPENFGKAGANGHVATSENINKVRVLVLSRWTSAEIAEELGITVPTLNKHYFRNRSIKKARIAVISEVRGRVMLLLEKQASAGNVAAIKEMAKMVEKAALELLAAEIVSKKPKKKVLGKKQQLLSDAGDVANGGGQGTARFLPKYDAGRVN